VQLGQLLKARNNGVCRQESSEIQDGDTGFIPERMCEKENMKVVETEVDLTLKEGNIALN